MLQSLDISERSSFKRAFAGTEADKDESSRLHLDIQRDAKKMQAAGSFDSLDQTRRSLHSQGKAINSGFKNTPRGQDELANESVLLANQAYP